MPVYVPEDNFEKFLPFARKVPGAIGRSAKRKIFRRCRARCEDYFMQHVADLGPGKVAFDFGANMGVYTKILADTGAEVHAFEPDPDTFALLKQNVAEYDNVTLYQEAVGLVAETATLFREHRYDKDPIGGSVGSSFVRHDEKMKTDGGIEITVTAFETALARASAAPRLIKMDIEGAEYAILDDIFSKPEIAGFDALFVETHERFAPETQSRIAELRDACLDLKYPIINLYWR